MKALLVIDVQNGVYFDKGQPPYDGAGLLSNINALIGRARAAGVPVLFIQNKDEKRPPDSALFDIHPELNVDSGDKRIVKTQRSAFLNTSLKETLDALSVSELVICGMKTPFCITAAVEDAAALGYRITVAQDAHSTHDTQGCSASELIRQANRKFAACARVCPTSAIDFG